MIKKFTFDNATINRNIGYNGLLKEVNGVNGTPRSIAPGFPDLEDQFNQMGIKYLRFHDNLGFGDLDNHLTENDSNSQLLPNIPTEKATETLKLIADLGNIRTIFPNAAAGMRLNDLNMALSSANYTMTDQHFKDVLKANSQGIERDILFRIGRTNRGGYEPPENFDIYAQLVRKLVERYSRDYAQTGLSRKIVYWEVWNEPDLTFFWNSNDPSLYYSFYEKIAKAVKDVDSTAKVGGAGVANGYNPGGPYIDGLLKYCKSNNVPIDFISWHYYANNTADPKNIIDIGNAIQSALTSSGFNKLESLCTEWNSTPFASTGVFSKLQSAKNAAYISSCLMYMQYTKVDRAYYYRGDASSFGLFNDEAGFCTYAAQAFHLYAKFMETPNILSGGDDFTSGITTLAAKNNSGNTINILAANYEIVKDFVTTNNPTESPLYRQHYVDGNRQINQLTDSWSLNEWFGGIDPTTITPNNAVTQKPTVAQIPIEAALKASSRQYTESQNGAVFNINNIKYGSYKLHAWRIKEGNKLDSMTPTEISDQVTHTLSGSTLTLTDQGATKSTVTLYTLVFDENVPLPTPSPAPATHHKTKIVSTETVNITKSFTSLMLLLPDKPLLTKGKNYKITFYKDGPGYITPTRCSKGFIFANSVNGIIIDFNNTQDFYSYDPSNGDFIPLIDNLQRYAESLDHYFFFTNLYSTDDSRNINVTIEEYI